MKEAIETDPEYLAQKQAEVAAMLAGEPPTTVEGQPEQFRDLTPPKPRKKRCDANKPRTPKLTPAAPALATDNAAKKKHLALVDKVHQERAKFLAAKDRLDLALAELNAFQDTLA